MPSPTNQAPKPPSPRLVGSAGASYRLIIKADGTVDAGLSRSSSISFTLASTSYDQVYDFAELTLDYIKRWRFTPGVRNGKPVRSALDLEMHTDARASDTLPAHVEWRYAATPQIDTLVGHWVTDPPLPPFAAEQVDSLHAALLRQLVAMGVVLPTAERRYCLASLEAASGLDTTISARLDRLAQQFRSLGIEDNASACLDGPHRVRLALPRLHRLEEGRTIFDVTGTQLPRWPFDFDARAWDRWRGQCLGEIRERASAAVECFIEPVAPSSELYAWYNTRERLRPAPRRPASDSEPVALTVVARSSGQFGIDTLRTVLAHVPRLSERAVRDAAPLCNSWSVWAPGDSGAIVVYGDVAEVSLRVTRANPTKVPNDAQPPENCARPEGRDPSLSAFFLGGVGSRPRDKVTLCVSTCGRRYVLDPQRHTLADQPHLRFAAASLRNRPTRDRDQLDFRVLVDPVPEGLVPLVVVLEAGRVPVTAYLMHDLGGGVWDWRVHYGDSWARREVLIYLVRP